MPQCYIRQKEFFIKFDLNSPAPPERILQYQTMGEKTL